jgi:hypothetical protein
VTAQAQLNAGTAPSLYTSVRSRLDQLLPTFRLEDQRQTIQDAYALLCRRALWFPVGGRPLHGSRLNDDGTPFQLGLTIAGSSTRLQFVSDVGPLSAGNAERGAAIRQHLPRIADALGSAGGVSHLSELLDEFAPPDDPELLADDSGPVWLGVSFAANRPASLKTYINARRGPEDARWSRLAAFAGVAGVAREWHEARACAAQLLPLGVSVTVADGASPKYRIYLGGYGRRFAYYEELARACGGAALAGLVRRYGRTLLADAYGYPTRSVVWSFGAEHGSFVDHKFELCGHCAFQDDVEARARSLAWLRSTGASAAPYTRAVDVLSGTSARRPRTRLHAYLGVGANPHGPYSTFYFNPAATLA